MWQASWLSILTQRESRVITRTYLPRRVYHGRRHVVSPALYREPFPHPLSREQAFVLGLSPRLALARRRLKPSSVENLSPALRVAAAAPLVHAALLRVGASVAAIVARRRARALAAGVLALVVTLCSLHDSLLLPRGRRVRPAPTRHLNTSHE